MSNRADTEFFEFENNRLAYRRFGNGTITLLAFHGFGQSGQVFSALQKSLGERYTILAIDLFFHGQSSYHTTQLLSKPDWARLIDAFLQLRQVNRFSLVGFSLGGRFALATVESFAIRIDQLVLIAPDGITRNVWYWIATGSSAGRWLFRRLLTHLPLLNAVGHGLTSIGLLNRTVMRFVEISLSTPQQRERVHVSWTQFRLIKPDLDQIRGLLHQYPVRVRFFTGAFDRIVPGRYILPLTKQLHHYELTVFQTGHNHLIELAGEQLD
ncbi:alpha/beta fold hydrolase [Spirosoma agri]|uniref:Alpha/beta hydrolase n=1 Tax=Spirosoma agri TaxID=1987381 RepID=A0A6M0IRC5_9BACT|nr:alpha/beta hydrolase [Spirosoma agri]NEU70532.1 alpha/beta hydrolase [Spirosoma agri]